MDDVFYFKHVIHSIRSSDTELKLSHTCKNFEMSDRAYGNCYLNFDICPIVNLKQNVKKYGLKIV
jgi:hypothetical protein